MLTEAQTATLKTAVLADPTALALLNAANDQGLADWLNADAPGPVKAWVDNADRGSLFEATPITSFDGLTAGKRDAWNLMLANAPVNFARNKMRKAVTDIWQAADATAILTAFTENASRAENIIGGTSATDSTVTALKRDWVGTVSAAEASRLRV